MVDIGLELSFSSTYSFDAFYTLQFELLLSYYHFNFQILVIALSK